MKTAHYDAVVIGSGPGGEGAALTLAQHGLSVALVERSPRVGGNCTHRGTIPSKVLRHAVQQFSELRHSALCQGALPRLRPDYPTMLGQAQQVIAQQVRVRRQAYDRAGVVVITGEARFVDSHTLEVREPEGLRKQLNAERFVVATGSRPYRPEDVDFAHPRILDSDTVLDLRETPRSITIYGAGVIGCEYASIFAGLDVTVNLVNTRERLLSYLDDEITDALSYHLRTQGVVLFHNESYERVTADGDGVALELRSGKVIKSDYFLWANGRTGNTAGLGLEELGIAVNHRGQVEVNEYFQTAQPHIYAVGDVVGFPALASASYDQGRFAAQHIINGVTDFRLVEDIPTGIYTNPEISSLGRTERELTEQRVPYGIGRATFENLARAQITGYTVGVLKILFHRETLEILGIHCFGHQAAEIIHIGQAIMAQSGEANTLRYFADTTFNYPTMAEAYRVAALDGLARI
ncbi:Si-specific NAD(P)(+) transhydrogenase [Inmirania thermothiophila]|uniref:Soluble pyridine nucleotide transhydrogenase n=1 Tax=Inmirania thermothiophila TaxID=1750597 RepID=A0A3N1XSV2_9GAMM|nr:Si-specific NAD(P)(+) transhydrogenase [Inmirania thermothiophila]ROR29720.1 NAD(P) transhydrogenase [Inmirania thermothiophila]